MGIKIAVSIPDIIGLCGVIMTLVAYALLQLRKLCAKHGAYGALNTIGSILILYSLCFDWNVSAFIMEMAWLGFSLYGLWHTIRRHIKSHHP